MAKRNKSALKANRQNIKRREHNRSLRAKLRTGLKGIRKNLDAITLPAGFHIELYAVVPDARHMAVGP